MPFRDRPGSDADFVEALEAFPEAESEIRAWLLSRFGVHIETRTPHPPDGNEHWIGPGYGDEVVAVAFTSERMNMRLETESHINGAFTGWTGRGTYRLVNGQCWQQTEYAYQYQYLYRPEARVWSDVGGYWLEVEGMDEKVPVRRVNCPDD